MSGVVSLPVERLPIRLRAAAELLAQQARPDLDTAESVLARLPQATRIDVVTLAAEVLDAADTADLDVRLGSSAPGRARIARAAAVAAEFASQAIVILDVAQDGTVTTTTWAERPGTPSLAIAEWAYGLEASAISTVPFQTVFGWGCGGRPTPLTHEQLARFGEAGRAYAERNTVREGDASDGSAP